MPDIYIDADPTKDYTYANRVTASVAFNDFVSELFLDNRAELLLTYPTFESFNEGFMPSEELMGSLVAQMEQTGISPTEEYLTDNKEAIAVVLKASLARKLWGEEAAYRVTTTHNDSFFAEAMSLLLNLARYRTILGNTQ